MGGVICGNGECKYRNRCAPFCRKEFVILNCAGMCSVFFDNRGNMRQEPMYEFETNPIEASEQVPPQEYLV